MNIVWFQTVACFAWLRRDWYWSIIEGWVKNAWVKVCQGKFKRERRQCILDIRWSQYWFACMDDEDLESYYADIDQARSMKNEYQQ
jgi:hypothetical protein